MMIMLSEEEWKKEPEVRTISRPLILLDVDGVVNLAQFASSRQRNRLIRNEGWTQHWTGEPRYSTRIVFNPRWRQLVKLLAETGAELAWASGWQDHANWHIAPLLGLPDLRWAPAVHGDKAATVVPWTEGRPWAWLEDYEAELETASALSQDRPHLPVLVDRSRGLALDHVAAVKSWLDSL